MSGVKQEKEVKDGLFSLMGTGERLTLSLGKRVKGIL